MCERKKIQRGARERESVRQREEKWSNDLNLQTAIWIKYLLSQCVLCDYKLKRATGNGKRNRINDEEGKNPKRIKYITCFDPSDLFSRNWAALVHSLWHNNIACAHNRAAHMHTKTRANASNDAAETRTRDGRDREMPAVCNHLSQQKKKSVWNWNGSWYKRRIDKQQQINWNTKSINTIYTLLPIVFCVLFSLSPSVSVSLTLCLSCVSVSVCICVSVVFVVAFLFSSIFHSHRLFRFLSIRSNHRGPTTNDEQKATMTKRGRKKHTRIIETNNSFRLLSYSFLCSFSPCVCVRMCVASFLMSFYVRIVSRSHSNTVREMKWESSC